MYFIKFYHFKSRYQLIPGHASSLVFMSENQSHMLAQINDLIRGVKTTPIARLIGNKNQRLEVVRGVQSEAKNEETTDRSPGSAGGAEATLMAGLM
eukprot:COSAG02_NODE_324_length_24643_cov_107.975228_7_plen_96_part_00